MTKSNTGFDHLKPEAHPLKQVFRRHGLTYAMVARHCGCSVGWIGQLMAGYRPIPNRIRGRLYTLAESLEPGGGQSLVDEAGLMAEPSD